MLLSVVMIFSLMLSREPAHPRDHCVECGYAMTGNASRRCPECGELYQISSPSRASDLRGKARPDSKDNHPRGQPERGRRLGRILAAVDPLCARTTRSLPQQPAAHRGHSQQRE